MRQWWMWLLVNGQYHCASSALTVVMLESLSNDGRNSSSIEAEEVDDDH